MKNKIEDFLGRILPALIFILLTPLSVLYSSAEALLRRIRKALWR